MTIHHSEGIPSPESKSELLGASVPSGVSRIAVEGLDPLGVDFAKRLVNLCELLAQKKMVVLSPATRRVVEDLDLFEWSKPYPDGMRDRGVPFFTGDKYLHADITNLESQFLKLRRSHEQGEILNKDMVSSSLHTVTPWNYRSLLSCIEIKIEERIQEIKRRCADAVDTPEGALRGSDFGKSITALIEGKPADTAAQVFRILLRAEREVGRGALRGVVEHLDELWSVAQRTQATTELKLQAFDRHLRKLGVALLERSLPFDRRDLEIRAKRILAEGHVDTFLGGDDGRGLHGRYKFAASWLQGRYEGQYCPTPFPSWQPTAKQESYEESFKIVTRARHHSYHSFGRLRMESRSLGSRPPLFREFLADTFEDVKLIRGDNIDAPPGRGVFATGAKLDKLFFALDGGGDRLAPYVNDESLWFREMLPALELCSAIFLRQWIGLTSPIDRFEVMKDRYYYIIDNDHFSSGYGCAYGIPASVVSAKLVRALYALGDSPNGAIDAGSLQLSVSDLFTATLQAGKLPLNLGNMSVLFGGMCNAFPVGSAPLFKWENELGGDWRDVYDHVHWSLRVWSYREDRKRVEDFVRPLSAADWEVRSFAVAGQQLFEAIRHRYGAWKNDQTPGADRAPRLLTRVYDIYRAHQLEGASRDGEEAVYLAVIDRGDPMFSPLPVLNCHTLELVTSAGVVTFPKNGSGAGARERALWHRHVVPLISQDDDERGEYEGSYELVLVGERDIKRG